MITLALDASTKSTGYSVFDGKELKESGCITATSTNLFRRIDKMIEGIESILVKYKVDEIALEDVLIENVGHNHAVFKALTYLQGFMFYLFDKYKITKIIFYTSSQWRKKCGIQTGRGIKRDALKPKDIAFAKAQFGIDVNDDIADSLGIGFCHVGGVLKKPETIEENDGFEFA